MADNTVEVDYELRSAQARAELKKVQEALDGITAKFNHQIGTAEAGITRLAAALQKMVDKQSKLGAIAGAKAQQRADGLLSAYYNRVGQGATATTAQSNQLNRAAGQALINDVANSAKQIQARVADAILAATMQQLRTSEKVIEARLKNAQFNTNQSLVNTTDRMLAARELAAARRREDALFAAENGRAALASRNRVETLNYNGGADLMGIQGRVMMNYMAVGTVFNGAKNLAAGIVELDKELHQFQAISTASNREMVAFKKNLLEVSATVPFTTLEMTKAATMLAQAGLSTADVIKSLSAVTMFATATGSDLTQAVDVVTSSITAFNLETSRTGDVANIFTASLNLSKLSVDKLVTAMNYIGPTANALGITLEETTAILGALSQSGVRASTMGTGFRALLTDLQTPSKKLTIALQAAGLSISDIDVKTKGFLPVIETLKKAGFGAAEAYEALEVRAAASYIALANNTGLAYDMQRAFTLSAAAVDANNIQMKSLSNTAKNFGSVISAAAYTGFEPLLGLLQKILEAATAVVSVLLKVPGALTVIATGVAALTTLTTIALGGALVKSLATMIPMLGTFSAGMAGVGVAAAGATPAVAGFTGVLGGLAAVARAHPLGVIVTGLVAAGVAIYSFTRNSKDLASQIDVLQGRVNELRGAADAAGQRIVSIDTAIQGLIDRKAELDDNELMRGAKIDELRAQFHELGLSIKDDTASVTDLIAELYNLRSAAAGTRYSVYTEAVSAKKLEIQAQQTQVEDLSKRNASGPWRTSDAMMNLLYSTGWSPASGMIRMLSSDKPNANDPDFIEAASKRFGPTIGEATRLGLGDLSTVQNDPQRASGLLGEVRTTINDLTLGLGGMNEEQAAAQQKNIDFLLELQTSLEPIVSALNSIGSSKADLKVLQAQVLTSAIEKSSSFSTLKNSQTTLQSDFNVKRAALNGQDLTSEKKIEALGALNDWLRMESDKQLEQFKDSFKLEQKGDDRLKGIDEESVASTLNTFVAQLTTPLNTEILKASAIYQKLLDKELKKAKTRQTGDLNRFAREIAAARNNEALDSAKAGYAQFLETSRANIVDHYDKLIEMAKDRPDDLERLQDDREDYLSNLEADTKEQDRINIEKRNEILKDALQREREAIADIAKGIEKQIDEAQQELRRTPPSAAMDALVQKIRDLTAALTGEMNKIGGIDTQIQGIEIGSPIDAKLAGQAAPIVRALIERGLSKAGAAAVAGNLSVESSFNPNAKGDVDPVTGMPTAFGLAQWRGSRWRELTASTDTPWNSGSQLDFLMAELKRDYPELLARLQSGTEDTGTLTTAFMNEFEKPNKNPAINHIKKRLEFAAGVSTDVSADSEKLKEIATETTNDVNANIEKSIKASSDAAIKALNARIANLKTQVKVNGDAGSIGELQQQIEDAYSKIMEAKLEKFDAQNAELKLNDGAEFNSQREQLQQEVRDAMNADVLRVMEEYYKAAEDHLDAPIKTARAELDAAQQPDMASKYTSLDIQAMQQNIVDKEREANVNRVLLLEQQIAEVRRRGAEAATTFGADSNEAIMWKQRENDLLTRNAELKAQVNALDQATARTGPSVAQAIQAANVAWAQQNGLLQQNGKDMVPIAQQVGNAWGEVLSGLQSGFSQFFMNIFSGTMSAKDAFKQLGSSILQMFAQIIAKALANQIIMSLFGGGGMGGDLLGGLFGVVGKATGGEIRAANGRSVSSPFRDGGNYKLMDGEYVMRQSAVSAIGVDKLDFLNNLGNRRLSEGALGARPVRDDKPNQSGHVNVWVVSPDQVPASSPTDIIATVADDIARRGTLKRMIQQVQMGAI